jgi:alpha-beta hydrolase superfamily lysophospholipase
MTILFLHGWQSTPGGVKPTFLKAHGHEVLNSALPDDDFDEAVRIAQAEFDQYHPNVVVGSSRGGAVAININAGLTPLVLLCPAWKRWGIRRLGLKKLPLLPSQHTMEMMAKAATAVYEAAEEERHR